VSDAETRALEREASADPVARQRLEAARARLDPVRAALQRWTEARCAAQGHWTANRFPLSSRDLERRGVFHKRLLVQVDKVYLAATYRTRFPAGAAAIRAALAVDAEVLRLEHVRACVACSEVAARIEETRLRDEYSHRLRREARADAAEALWANAPRALGRECLADVLRQARLEVRRMQTWGRRADTVARLVVGPDVLA
jgi:hypothetical protein